MSPTEPLVAGGVALVAVVDGDDVEDGVMVAIEVDAPPTLESAGEMSSSLLDGAASGSPS